MVSFDPPFRSLSDSGFGIESVSRAPVDVSTILQTEPHCFAGMWRLMKVKTRSQKSTNMRRVCWETCWNASAPCPSRAGNWFPKSTSTPITVS